MDILNRLRNFKVKIIEKKFSDPKFLEYSFDKLSPRLKNAKKKEITHLSNEANQSQLSPLISIEKPRYSLHGNNKYYSADDSNKDGIGNIILIGDIMCRSEQQKMAKDKDGKFNFQGIFPHIEKVFSSADFIVGNLETTLSESALYTCQCNRNDGNLNRNAPSTFLDPIKQAGFDMLVTSNNHCLDGAVTGIYQTICHLMEYGFIHTGTFLDERDRSKNPFTIVEVDGIKVGVLAYTYGTNGRAQNLFKEKSKVCFINKYKKSLMEKDVSALRKAGAEFIICYIHWGVEFSHDIDAKQLRWGQELADAGIDFIAGSHPHVVEPFGYITAKDGRVVPVIYSMGNFISSMNKEPRRDSVAINLKLAKDTNEHNHNIIIKEISYIPFYTCEKYDGINYATVPLVDSLCEGNKELQESRERISEVIGDKIKESDLVHQ